MNLLRHNAKNVTPPMILEAAKSTYKVFSELEWAAIYSKEFFHFGAGANQLKNFIHSYGDNPIDSPFVLFDDPRDYDMIDWGYELYQEDN